MSNQASMTGFPKTSEVGKGPDRLQEVCLSLRVVSVQDDKARLGVETRRGEVPPVGDLETCQAHEDRFSVKPHGHDHKHTVVAVRDSDETRIEGFP